MHKAKASQVSLLVLLHVARVTETFAAMPAAEGLLPGVVAQMHRQVARLTEALPAHRAAVRLLPGVHPAVLLVVARVSEGAPAQRAAVGFPLGPLERSRARAARFCVLLLLLFFRVVVSLPPVETRVRVGRFWVWSLAGCRVRRVIEAIGGARGSFVQKRLCFHFVVVFGHRNHGDRAHVVGIGQCVASYMWSGGGGEAGGG